MARLLGISGSLRRASTNTMLVREAARLFGPDQFDMADLNLPLYNGDVEDEGMPEAVTRLCDQIRAADGLIISTTEYNKGPSGVLKNALDWVSRVRPLATEGKPVAALSAAAGYAGGQRATAMLYLMLIPFGVRLVAAPEVAIGGSGGKFDENGRLTDEQAVSVLTRKMEALRAAL